MLRPIYSKLINKEGKYHLIYSQLKGTWKCAFYEQLSFIYRLKLYALFIKGIKGKIRLCFMDSDLLRCHDITEIFLKSELNTITLLPFNGGLIVFQL